MSRSKTRDAELVRALIAGWDRETVRAVGSMIAVGIAATTATDSFNPDPETRALVQRARNAEALIWQANTARGFVEEGR